MAQAIEQGDTFTVAKLIQQNTVTANGTGSCAKLRKEKNSRLASHLAVMAKNKASVETLLINGADISFKTPDRWSAMAKITNKQLSKSGVPHVDVSTNTSLSPSTNGQMNFQKWNLDMNPTLTNAPQLSDVKTQQLGDTLFHESRHAEQWFLIAQNEAGKGESAQDIGTIGVPDNVARKLQHTR